MLRSRNSRYAAALLFVLTATILGFFKPVAATFFLVATVMVVIAPKMESVVEFSLGPLRAKLERNISQSEKLLQELSVISGVIGRVTASAAAHTGRFAQSNDWIFVATKEIEGRLKSVGADAETLASVRKDLVRFTIRDAGIAALGKGRLPSDLPSEALAEWNAITGPHIDDPDQVEAWLKKWDRMTPKAEMLVDDMRWMIANNDVRDSAQYLRAHAYDD